MSQPILFTHYGNTDYLSRTLAAASLTNPGARRILIGDASNRDTAHAAGWEHVDLDIQTSPLRSEFLASFREVQGVRHRAYKGGRNWLRYVCERWYAVESLIAAENIGSFWHFDSDVMIVTELESFENQLRDDGVDFTRQCNNVCLNGYVTAPVVRDFCRFMIAMFRNDELVARYQHRYDTLHPGHALTEMEAFRLFCGNSAYRGFHLESHFPGWWFDDALAQDDGFSTARMGWLGPAPKDVTFDGRQFTGRHHGAPRVFTSLNCSWLPLSVFDWILGHLQHPGAGKRRLAQVPPGVMAQWTEIKRRAKAALQGAKS